MFDHIGLHVLDLEKSLRFYERALAPLGHVRGSADEHSASFGPPGAASLYLYSAGKGTGTAKRSPSHATHIALRAEDRKAVRSFHEAGLRAGGRDNGAPGVRADYDPKYYAAFLIDPDGNNVEAVCLREA